MSSRSRRRPSRRLRSIVSSVKPTLMRTPPGGRASGQVLELRQDRVEEPEHALEILVGGLHALAPGQFAEKVEGARLLTHADLRIPVRRAATSGSRSSYRPRRSRPRRARAAVRRRSSGCSRGSTPSGCRATSPGTASAEAGTELDTGAHAPISEKYRSSTIADGAGKATFECVRPSCTSVSAILIPTGPGLITGAGRWAAM